MSAAGSPLNARRAPSTNRLAEIARKNYTTRDIDDDDEDNSYSPYNINTAGADNWNQIDYGRGGKYPAKKVSPRSQYTKSNSQTSLNNTTTDDILKMLDEEFPEDIGVVIKTSSKSGKGSSPSLSSKMTAGVGAVSSGRGPPPDDPDLGDQAAALAKERAELKRMMEELQQEKLKVMNMNSYDMAKKRQSEEEAKMAVKERDELRTALATLRAKNTWLAKTMETTEKEAQAKIEQERSSLQQAMEQMEAQNRHLTQQVLNAQDAAERRLAAEKLEFRNALKAMEAEKLELAQRVLKTETEAREEAERIKAQKEEFERRVIEMQSEKSSILAKVQENEEKAKHATKAMAEQLAKEREALAAEIKRMEDEKNSLSANLTSMQQTAAEHAKSLENQLHAERQSLQEALEKMEREKEHLANHLTETEKIAQEQAKKVAEQLAKEKEAMEETLKAMEREKQELAARLQSNEKEVETQVVNLSTAADQLAKEKESLRKQMEKMQREREELQAELQRAKELKEAEEKEKELRLAKERDELKSAVERMKAEMDLEKKQQEMLFSAAFTADIDSNSANNSSNNLTSKKSLYDVMAEDGAQQNRETKRVPSTNKLQTHMSRQIMTIKESANETDEDAVVSAPQSSPGKSSAKTSSKTTASKPPPNLDLPPIHKAAACGDMVQLKKFWENQPSLLSSQDGSGRSPLFYAMAYDQHEAAFYLVNCSPELVLEVDSHGDTPLHAAASGGSARCIDLFIRTSRMLGETIISPVNKMGMTPAHLAKNVDSMEALFANGANFSIRDSSLRSPLFIAAAMNRSDCVQYIIDNCLEGDDDALYAADGRGDTPLHAAACNGAADCVLLLLQCGINPLTTNKAGLRAIDLAQKNKKMKCREILAQYHLHFATASDFDSVGFIATLEGHKQLKSSVKTGGYDIIKKGNAAAGDCNEEQPHGMKKVQSLFSLRTDQSIRLQRIGSWIIYHDDATNSVYYYNQTSRTGQWETPEKIKQIQTQALANSSGASTSFDGFGKALQTKLSMRLKKVGDWIQYSTGAGRVFYYNDKNGDFKWVTPEVDNAAASEGDSVTPKPKNVEEPVPDSLSAWRAYKDPTTGALFWYNEITKVSQWECPDESLVKNAKSRHGDDHHVTDENVVIVQSDEDLGLF